jgi:hypothetical protein
MERVVVTTACFEHLLLLCPVIDAQSDDINARVRFTCNAAAAVGEEEDVAITWWFAKELGGTQTQIIPTLQQGASFFAESRNVLQVRDVGAEFEGIFMCEVTNTSRNFTTRLQAGCLYVLGEKFACSFLVWVLPYS